MTLYHDKKFREAKPYKVPTVWTLWWESKIKLSSLGLWILMKMSKIWSGKNSRHTS